MRRSCISVMPTDFNIIDDGPEEPREPSADDRLNRQRIRAIALDRRAAHRRLLWARGVVFLFGCAAAVTTIDALRVDGPRRWWFALGSTVFLLLAIRAALRLPRFAIKTESADDPVPDPRAFAPLSDGSQFVRGLDELKRED